MKKNIFQINNELLNYSYSYNNENFVRCISQQTERDGTIKLSTKEFNKGTQQSCRTELGTSTGIVKYLEASPSKKLLLLGLKKQREQSVGGTQRRLVYGGNDLEWQMEDINSNIAKFHL